MADRKIMSQYKVKSIVLLKDQSRELNGPWRFESDGTIGAFPRFVRADGMLVPFHAVSSMRVEDGS